jgi:hypothetical protein
MTDNEKVKLAKKAIRDFAVEHYGWDAKYHPEAREKYDALMEMADNLRGTGCQLELVRGR